MGLADFYALVEVLKWTCLFHTLLHCGTCKIFSYLQFTDYKILCHKTVVQYKQYFIVFEILLSLIRTYNNAFAMHRIINIKFISWLINVPVLLYIFDWNSSLQDCNNFTIPLHMLVMQSQAGSPSQSNSSRYL